MPNKSIDRSIVSMYVGLVLLVGAIWYRIEHMQTLRDDRIKTVDQRFDALDQVTHEVANRQLTFMERQMRVMDKMNIPTTLPSTGK